MRPADVDHSKGQAPAAVAVMEPPAVQTPPAVSGAATVAELRAMALRGLARMYDRKAGQFIFCVRKSERGIAPEGLSDRYTSMTAIGLAGEEPDAVRSILGGDTLRAVIQRLIDRVETTQNVGDASLLAWAGQAVGCATDRVWERVLALDPAGRSYPTVEVAWTLSAVAIDRSAKVGTLGERLARRLQNLLSPHGLFPHHVGEDGATSQRSHVSCFADLHQALAIRSDRRRRSIRSARCARRYAGCRDLLDSGGGVPAPARVLEAICLRGRAVAPRVCGCRRPRGPRQNARGALAVERSGNRRPIARRSRCRLDLA